ncbi:MAG: hypothetical protein ABIL58_05190 [Pseudomonadota bacterium]
MDITEEVFSMLRHRLPLRPMLFLLLMAFFAMPALGEAAGLAAGPSKEYTAIGSGRITKGNTANARQEAIDNGLNAAIAMAVIELVPADTFVGHFAAVSQAISGRSNEFLQGYKVLAETPAGNDYRVMVSATVSLDALRRQFNAAGITLSRKVMPRTLLFIVEKDVLQQLPSYWWGGDAVMTENDSQKVLGAKLREAGFSVLSPTRPEGGSAQVLDYPPNIDIETLVHLASAYRAEVVVVGTARAALASNTMGDQLRSYRAVVGVKAIRVADRKILATVEQESVATASEATQGGRKAMDAAAVQAGETLARQLAPAWLVSEDVLSRVEIAIEGTRDLANFVTFRRIIKTMPGVKSTQTTEMKPDQAALVVEYQGDVAALAESLMRTTFDNFGIDIKDVSGDKMRVALRPK